MRHTEDKLRSGISRAKGLGASGHAVPHWMLQRITAIALVPLGIWFMTSLLVSITHANVFGVVEWFTSPVTAVAMVLFLIAMFTHAKLGVQVIIEDYVRSSFWKYTLVTINTLACWALAIAGILAVLKLHFLDVMATSL